MSEPENYEQMLKLPHVQQEKWREAMLTEYKFLQEHDVFSPVKLPEDENVVGCRWVCKLKTLPDNTLQYKTHLVA